MPFVGKKVNNAGIYIYIYIFLRIKSRRRARRCDSGADQAGHCLPQGKPKPGAGRRPEECRGRCPPAPLRAAAWPKAEVRHRAWPTECQRQLEYLPACPLGSVPPGQHPRPQPRGRLYTSAGSRIQKRRFHVINKNEQIPLFLPLLPGGHAAGTSPSLTSKVLLFIHQQLWIISQQPCPRVQPRRHATQLARSEIFKLSLSVSLPGPLLGYASLVQSSYSIACCSITAFDQLLNDKID